ncbi:hypothetical protein CGC20_12600 [Leishmania donovani]|uniref:Uncharacterized protein n=1 Tax=Leishmania donovani TaxID=5661 RepID=A0A504WYB3_LEIDO|nr:hypothetical protein CGC20_12600 [Leishmania donovani]
MDRLILQDGSAGIHLINRSWLTVGSATFAISVNESASLGQVRKDGKHDARESRDATLEMQSSFFLQWPVGELFDFVVPVKGRKARGEEDKYFAYQNPLYDTPALEFASLQPARIVTLNAKITAAMRLMGAELAKELREHADLRKRAARRHRRSGFLEAKRLQLKGKSLLVSSAIVRRLSTTVDLPNVSINAKALRKRDVQHVSATGMSFFEKGVDASVLGELLLLIVNAVLSTDYCIQWHMLSTTERKRTPQSRRSTGKPRSDMRVLSPPAALSGTASRKTSLSRTTPNAIKTPHSLSSFATFRKSSVPSATCSAAGARLFGDRRFRTSEILQQSALPQEAVRLSCCYCGAEAVYWNLLGHSEDVLCAAAHGRVCATGDVEGAVLLWRFAGAVPEHVCCMNTGGPAVVDVAWSGATALLAAQGDGCATVWDVEKGARLRTISRFAVKGRCAWPVVNCVAATARGSFVFGGDDGYLVTADKRSDKVVVGAHIAVPLTSAATTGFSLFVGDVCGTLHWFDIRAGSREMERIVCGSAGITSIITDPLQDRVITYSMSGTVQVIDTQPFALSSSDRLLGATELGVNERQALLRGAWVPHSDAVVMPNGKGNVVSVSAKDVVGGATRTVHAGSTGSAMNVSVCVDDEYIVCSGDGGEVAAYKW